MQPEIVYFARSRLPRIPKGRIGVLPDLAVEVLSVSTGALDRGAKRELYERGGIPHYWIVDPAERSLEAYELRSGRYQLVARPGADDVFEPGLFPGLRIRLARLWPEA